jgi:hypothetical protein
MVFNAILNALKSVFKAIFNASKSDLNASKVGSHFSFYHCACVVTITVSPARNYLRDLLLQANQGRPAGCGVAPVSLWGARTATF